MNPSPYAAPLQEACQQALDSNGIQLFQPNTARTPGDDSARVFLTTADGIQCQVVHNASGYRLISRATGHGIVYPSLPVLLHSTSPAYKARFPSPATQEQLEDLAQQQKEYTAGQSVGLPERKPGSWGKKHGPGWD